tara:strand:+ start:154 stop:360 length:207 start_codon:yes stop_codon:yes gene_type:complete
MVSHTRIFDTEEEAWAFADGIEFVNDSSLEVESVELSPEAEASAYATGPWVVNIIDHDFEDKGGDADG